MKLILLNLISILLTFNICAQWVEKYNIETGTLYTVDFYNEKFGYVGGSQTDSRQKVQPLLLKTKDGGNAWIQSNFLANFIIKDIIVIDEKTSFALARDVSKSTNAVSLFKTVDSGKVWLNIKNFSAVFGENAESVNFLNKDTGFVVSYQKIFKTFNGGNDWDEYIKPNYGQFSDIKFLDNVGYCVAVFDTNSGNRRLSRILKTTDYGYSWIPIINNPKDKDANIKLTLNIVSDRLWYAFGDTSYNNSTIMFPFKQKSTDKGETWSDYISNNCDIPRFSKDNMGFILGMNSIWGTSSIKKKDIQSESCKQTYCWEYTDSLQIPALINDLKIISPEISYTVGSGKIFKYDENIINSISDSKTVSDIKIYPNPTADVLNISTDGSLGNYSLDIIDNLGLTVFSNVFSGTSYQLDVKNLSEGIYFIKLLNNSNNKRETQKIIIE